MLYKKIHLTNSFDNCLINSPSYALSVETYIENQGQNTKLYIELDSILKYSGIDEDISTLIDKVDTERFITLSKRTIDDIEKIFVYYKHLNPILALLHFHYKKLGKDNYKLRDIIGDLYYNVISSWHSETLKIKKTFARLDIFYKTQEHVTHKQVDEITNMVKMFSS